MAQGRNREKNLELKVGAMIIAALLILVVFIFAVSDITFGETKKLTIFFQNPGGLSPGVSVKVAGRKIGKVTSMTYMGQAGPKNPMTGSPAYVRVTMDIQGDVYNTLRNDVRFYITSKGVLGDPFLEIDPGVASEKMDADGPHFGIDPPRLDLFLADAAELVRALNRLLVTNSEELDNLIQGSSQLLTSANTFLASEETMNDGKERVARILGNVEQLTTETRELISDVNSQYVDNPEIKKTIRNLKSISATLDRDLDDVLADVKQTMDTLNRLGDTIGPEEKEEIQRSLRTLAQMANRTNNMVAKVDKMVSAVQNGKGTVGQLLKDEEIYDDLKELLRDIKHHPWKLIWDD